MLPSHAAFQPLAGWLLIGAPLQRRVEDALENPDRAAVLLTIAGAARLTLQEPRT